MAKTTQENAARLDLYNNDRILAWILKKLEKESSKENFELIKKYDKLMTSLSMSKATRVKQLRTIYNLNKFYDQKDWAKLTKEDALDLVAEIMRKYSTDGQETNTTWDHKKILKIFIRWVMLGSREFSEVGDPQQTKWIKLRKVKDRIAREDLLTEDDRTKLLHTCKKNPRDRALFDVQFEAGTRPGELLNLKIKHVKFDDYGAIIKVDGKTGSRQVRLIKSAQALMQWYNAHPLKDNPEAPLWPILTKHNLGKSLSYSSVRQLLVQKCADANLGKRVYLNLFRHSEATETANFMTEAQMKLRHGWTNASKMPARYVHLVNSDVDKVILERYGLKKEDKQELKAPRKCMFCDQINSPDVNRCEKCLKPLDLKTAAELDEQKDEKLAKIEEKFQKTTDDLKKAMAKFRDAKTVTINESDITKIVYSVLEKIEKERAKSKNGSS